VPRAIRERPRYALLLGLGLACLVGIGLVAGLLLAGGDDSPDADAAAATRQARELRSTRAELDEVQAELETLRSETEAAGNTVARQRARAEGWRRRAQRLEQRNGALQRALTQARQQ
jgi:outer membrane murein-binding lipoprotein Lpp